MTKIAYLLTFVCALICALHAAPAQAQRVFVSATGSDGNPCSFASPCRSFQRAHDVTAANGEIDVLDPAGYGPVTITKSISIQGHGFSGITATSGNAININASVNDKVNLRGLLIDGGHAGTNGINVTFANIVNIQDSQIRNFAGDGIFFGPPPNEGSFLGLFVSNTVISDNGVNGVSIGPQSEGAVVKVVLDHAQLVGNGTNGVIAVGNVTTPVTVLVSNSVSALNGTNGVLAQGAGNATAVMVQNSSIFSNTGDGLLADAATIKVTKSTLRDNSTEFDTAHFGTLISFGDNSLDDSGRDGIPTITASLK